MTKEVVVHALKVLGYIVLSALVAGLGVLVDNKPELTQSFVQGLVNYGIPAAVANMIVAAAVKYIKLKAAELQD